MSMNPAMLLKCFLGLLLLITLPLRTAGSPREIPTGAATENPSIRLNQKGDIHIESSAVPIALVLEKLSNKTGIPIHSRYNSMTTITKVCAGGSVPSILHCLLGEDADLMIKHGGSSRNSANKGISSIEILASTFPTYSTAITGSKPDKNMSVNTEAALGEISAMVKSTQPSMRAIGLERLGAIKTVAASAKREAFLAGLKDDEADVRAEAVTGLAMLEGNDRDEILKSALGDIDPAVRLAAVDAMDTSKDSRNALINALSDPDESVRELASMRLGIQP